MSETQGAPVVGQPSPGTITRVETPGELTFRTATIEDAARVALLVQRAYRGEASRQGWTTEADLLDDQRIDPAGVIGKIRARDSAVLLAFGPARSLVACCELLARGPGLAYFGMFAVDPTHQAGGIGRRVLVEAERLAQRLWGSTEMEMTVIEQRTELISWYLRRGYARTGARRPFPFDEIRGGRALRDDLVFTVLSKALGPSSAD